MNKIPTIFERDWEGDRSRVLEVVVPGCEWVFEGDGSVTRKYDGTCVMFDGTSWWARREVKEGKQVPPNFRPMEHDHKTLKAVGWEPIEQSPFSKFHAEAIAFDDSGDWPWRIGTYELCGPKVQGNPEKFEQHILVCHETAPTAVVLRTFNGLQAALAHYRWEGFVFHGDNRMAKIKGRDFGLKRD